MTHKGGADEPDQDVIESTVTSINVGDTIDLRYKYTFTGSDGSSGTIHFIATNATANGAFSESFFTGPDGLNALETKTRQEVLLLVPELMTDTPSVRNQTARMCLNQHEAMMLERLAA